MSKKSDAKAARLAMFSGKGKPPRLNSAPAFLDFVRINEDRSPPIYTQSNATQIFIAIEDDPNQNPFTSFWMTSDASGMSHVPTLLAQFRAAGGKSYLKLWMARRDANTEWQVFDLTHIAFHGGSVPEFDLSRNYTNEEIHGMAASTSEPKANRPLTAADKAMIDYLRRGGEGMAQSELNAWCADHDPQFALAVLRTQTLDRATGMTIGAAINAASN